MEVPIAAQLAGGIDLPPADELRRRIDERLRWMGEQTDGRHARGTNIIPFSLRNIDEVLGDLRLNVGPLTRSLQWLLPVNPASYRKISHTQVARNAKARTAR